MTLDGLFGGSRRAQLGLGNDGELFSLRSRFPGGGARGGSRASLAFQGFYPTRSLRNPHLPPPPQPPADALSGWCGPGAVVRGAEGWPRPVLCCSCSVMSGCYRSGRAVPVRAGLWRPRCAAPGIPQQSASRPSPTSAPWLGWVPVLLAKKKRTLRPNLRRLLNAGSQPARELALEWGKGERELHKGR